MSKLRNKLIAIYHILRSDLYTICTIRSPKHDSEYMQAGWFHYQMTEEEDPYFLSLVKKQLQEYEDYLKEKNNHVEEL